MLVFRKGGSGDERDGREIGRLGDGEIVSELGDMREVIDSSAEREN